MQELTSAVVGIDFQNADGSNRRSEAMMTLPGAPTELVPEPKNKHDPNAIAVFSPTGVQLGYVNAERAPYINSRMSRGEMWWRFSNAWTAGRPSFASGLVVGCQPCRHRLIGRQPHRDRFDRRGGR